MYFLKEKVKKYQEKKLSEAKQKLDYYTEIKNHLEKQLQNSTKEESFGIKEKIEKQKEFIEIWSKNIIKINKELKKLKS